MTSKPHHLEKDELQQALAPYVRGGFFTVDVTGIHDAVEAAALGLPGHGAAGLA